MFVAIFPFITCIPKDFCTTGVNGVNYERGYLEPAILLIVYSSIDSVCLRPPSLPVHYIRLGFLRGAIRDG